MKPGGSVRVHLNPPAEPTRRSSFDFNLVPSAPTAVTLNKTKVTTAAVPNTLSIDIDGGPRSTRFSNVSSSYAQFLKQRDMDKVKRIVSDRLSRDEETLRIRYPS